MKITKTKKNEETVLDKEKQEVAAIPEAEVTEIPEVKEEDVVKPAEEPEQEPAKEKKEKEKDDSPIAIAGTDITENELASLKKDFKKLFQTFYIDKVYVWHRLNRKTFNTVCDDTKDIEDEDELVAERERRFCRDCIVYPRAKELEGDLDDDVIPTKLAQEILYKSGFFRPVTQEL